MPSVRALPCPRHETLCTCFKELVEDQKWILFKESFTHSWAEGGIPTYYQRNRISSRTHFGSWWVGTSNLQSYFHHSMRRILQLCLKETSHKRAASDEKERNTNCCKSQMLEIVTSVLLGYQVACLMNHCWKRRLEIRTQQDDWAEQIAQHQIDKQLFSRIMRMLSCPKLSPHTRVNLAGNNHAKNDATMTYRKSCEKRLQLWRTGGFQIYLMERYRQQIGERLTELLASCKQSTKRWGGSVHLDVILVGLMSPLCPALQCLPTPIPLAMGGNIKSPKENCFQKL